MRGLHPVSVYVGRLGLFLVFSVVLLTVVAFTACVVSLAS